MKAIKTRFFAGLALFGFPGLANAHVKWFVDPNHIPADSAAAFRVTDQAVLIWFAVLSAALVVAYLLDRFSLPPPRTLLSKGRQWEKQIIYLFQVIVGISLISAAYQGAVLAPHLKESSSFALLLRLVQALAGTLFILNFKVFWGALLLMGVFIGNSVTFGFLMTLEYLNLLGIALFLLLMKAPPHTALSSSRSWALPLLRLFTGIALVSLAFTEKLLRPELALAFLDQYDINFMKMAGLKSFSDHLFVLCAGCSELLFGMIFLSGFVTRINTIALASFLIASNTYFYVLGMPLQGNMEAMGHANLFAIALIFIFYGAGEKLHLRLPGRRKRDQAALKRQSALNTNRGVA